MEDVYYVLKKKHLFLECQPLLDIEKNRPEDLMAQSKVVVTQTPIKLGVPTKKFKMGFNHIPIYEGEEDPKIHWFVCENFWDATNITNEDKKMPQFGATLRHRTLTWFMNYTEKQTCSREEIKNSFLTFFKIQDITHLVAQKFKEIKQKPCESVREHEKRFKDLLNQISSMIDYNLLVQCHVVRPMIRIRSPLRLYEITNCEYALQKAK